MSDLLFSISGCFYDGKTSRPQPCVLQVTESGAVQLAIGQEPYAEFTFSQLRISSRLANTPRFIDFPDGGKFETPDNDTVDQWQKQFDSSLLTGLAHYLESHKRFVVVGVLVVMVTLWVSIKYLIPASSEVIARQLPSGIPGLLGQKTMSLLDTHFLSESKLDEQRQQQLQYLFSRYFSTEQQQLGLTLHFRSSEELGANAFALPSGDLIFTDAIVNLAGNDFEILSVMAHEVGHIAHRHLLRRVVQDSMLVFVLTMVTGDISGVSAAVAAAPVAMLELAYSRNFEIEADHFAREFMQQHDVDLVHFANMMQRLEWLSAYQCKTTSGLPEEMVTSGPSAHQQNSTEDDQDYRQLLSRMQNYLSTHPLMTDRIDAFGQPTVPRHAVIAGLPDCERDDVKQDVPDMR